MRDFFFLLMLVGLLMSCSGNSSSSGQSSRNAEFIDPVSLRSNDQSMVTNADSFFVKTGLPDRVRIGVEEFSVATTTQLDSLLAAAISSKEIKLYYPGLVLLFQSEHQIVPYSMDVRKMNKPLYYENIKLDTSYTVQQFANDFPSSYNASYVPPQSLFAIETLETGSGYQHFAVLRKSGSSDPSFVEWTFQNDHLVYLIFSEE